MAQDWTNDVFAAGHVAQTDLQNMENNFLALQSAFSGAVQPAGAVAGQIWHDTANNLLKCYYGAGWITVFDLANVLVALATNCSRSVIAGTLLTGGGALTGNVTLNHGAHTGEVTGTAALTVADNTITPAKCYPGGLVVVNDSTHATQAGTVFTDTLFYKIKCPSGPTVLRFYCRAKKGSSGVNCNAKANVTGIAVGSSIVLGNSYAWYDCGAINMAGATPGTVYDITLQLVTANASFPAEVQGLSVWWE